MKKHQLATILFRTLVVFNFQATAQDEEKQLIIQPRGSLHVEGYWASTTPGQGGISGPFFKITPKDQHHSSDMVFDTEWANEVELSHDHSNASNMAILKSFSYNVETLEFLGLMYGVIMTPNANSSIHEKNIQHRITQSHQLTYKIQWQQKPDYIQIMLLGNDEEISDIRGQLLTGNQIKSPFTVVFEHAPGFRRIEYLGRKNRPYLESNEVLSQFKEIIDERREETVFSRLTELFKDALKRSSKAFRSSFSSGDWKSFPRENIGDPVKDILNKNDVTFNSTFQSDALDISFSIHKNPHGLGQTLDWWFDYGIAGLLIRPVFIEQQTEHCYPERAQYLLNWVGHTAAGFLATLTEVSCALKFLKEGYLQPETSYELRNILVKKLKNNDAPHLKELYAQLIRKVNQYQKQNILPKNEQELAVIHTELENERNLIERLVYLLAAFKEGRLKQNERALETAQSLMQDYISEKEPYIKLSQAIRNSLDPFMRWEGELTHEKVDSLCDEILKVTQLYSPTSEKIKKLEKQIRLYLLTNNFDVVYELLRRIRCFLEEYEAEITSDTENLKILKNDLSSWTEHNTSWKSFEERLVQQREEAKTLISSQLQRERELNIQRDLTESDSLIFEMEAPWEHIN